MQSGLDCLTAVAPSTCFRLHIVFTKCSTFSKSAASSDPVEVRTHPSLLHQEHRLIVFLSDSESDQKIAFV